MIAEYSINLQYILFRSTRTHSTHVNNQNYSKYCPQGICTIFQQYLCTAVESHFKRSLHCKIWSFKDPSFHRVWMLSVNKNTFDNMICYEKLMRLGRKTICHLRQIWCMESGSLSVIRQDICWGTCTTAALTSAQHLLQKAYFSLSSTTLLTNTPVNQMKKMALKTNPKNDLIC